MMLNTKTRRNIVFVVVAVVLLFGRIGALSAQDTAAQDPSQEDSFLEWVEWMTQELAKYAPSFFFSFAAGLASVIVIWILFFRCREKKVRRLLLAPGILLPLHMLGHLPILWVFLYLFINPFLLVAMIPYIIISIKRKDRALGAVTALCCLYLILGIFSAYQLTCMIAHAYST